MWQLWAGLDRVASLLMSTVLGGPHASSCPQAQVGMAASGRTGGACIFGLPKCAVKTAVVCVSGLRCKESSLLVLHL